MKEVIVIFKSEHHLVAGVAPIDVLGSRADVDSPYVYLSVPVVERNEVLALDSEQTATEDPLDAEANLENFELLHVFVNLDFVIVAANCECVLCGVVSRPNQVEARPESCVREFGELIDDEIVVAAD